MEASIKPIKKKVVSFSQFSNFFTCEYKWYRDVVLKEKTFEDNLIMSFGTAIHDTIQLYLKTLYEESEEKANSLDLYTTFIERFKGYVEKKKIPHTPEEFSEFCNDGKNILTEFVDPVNRVRYFPKEKWELIGIEHEINENVLNNTSITAKLDMVLKNKTTNQIKIIDFKTSTRAWSSNEMEKFTKYSQLLLYKALYSKHYNIPTSKIITEFFILKRKLYKESSGESRLQLYSPPSSDDNILEVIQEFSKFIKHCFTENGQHNKEMKYRKIPGEGKANCKYCQYLKSGKCDGKADKLD